MDKESELTESEFTWAIAKQFVDQAIFDNIGKHLSDIDLVVLQGAWEGKSYAQIAEEQGYTLEYINSDVGFMLWSRLSEAITEKVTKRNFRSALERHWQNRKSTQSNNAKAIGSTTTPGYICRPPTEEKCFDAIQKPGALIRIKAPRKMGKTWLLEHIQTFAAEQNYHTVPINLLRLEGSILNNLDRFLKSFALQVTRQLKLPNELDQFWDEGLGSNTSCTEYFEEHILPSCDRPIVLALDNVDRLFPYREVADNFFSLLRAWYEDARILEEWQKLRLIIAHSTEIYPTLNVNRSPFNVGLAIELGEFTLKQVQQLAAPITFSSREETKTELLNELMALVGGHPYLLQTALDAFITEPHISLRSFIAAAPTDSGVYAQHLRDLLAYLLDNPDLAIAMKTVLQASDAIKLKPEQGFMLHSLGLVQFQGNEVATRCSLYQKYFSDQLE